MGITIGEVIRYCRKEKNITQKQLASDYITVRYLSKIEQGKANVTVDVLTHLSTQMGVDLYAMYGKMKYYKDFYTYLQCRGLSEAIGSCSFDEVKKIFLKCKGDIRFGTGIEKQVMAYAKAVLLGNEKDYEGAAIAAMEGLDNHFITKNDAILNVEFALALCHAVNRCRLNEEGGAEELLELYRISKEKWNSVIVQAEGREHFWGNVSGNCLYNIYLFTDRCIINEIDEFLNIQKSKGILHMMSELLLCKSAWLMRDKREDEAWDSYETARIIGEFYHSKEWFDKTAQCILNVKTVYELFKK